MLVWSDGVARSHGDARERHIVGDDRAGRRSVRGCNPQSGGNTTMNNDFPYATHLNVLFEPLQKIALDPVVEAVADKWYNQTLARVNDSVVRLGVVQGEYHWH